MQFERPLQGDPSRRSDVRIGSEAGRHLGVRLVDAPLVFPDAANCVADRLPATRLIREGVWPK